MPSQAYKILEPKTRQSSVIFASPHSGRDYPADFLQESVLDGQEIRSSEDAFVDQLIEAAPSLGAPALLAQLPRAYVDLNRARSELDPAVVEGIADKSLNPRIASGLGVIPRVVAGGRSIYSGKLIRDEAEARLSRVWDPYHGALAALMRSAHNQFGEAILVDCHSMPHEALEAMSRNGRPRPDVVLGDRFGASAHVEITDRIARAFSSEGLTVARNSPFAGAHIVQHYGRPAKGHHAIQIEIDRALYMDEATITPRPDFEDFRALFTRAMAEIAQIGRPKAQMAAE
ncbi:N-formylglutamate amidohydrolase [Actibacterium pelagium]|uniref:N-formylglutamate amidohydrolase n=1 Tax=Actibacterium pelagium TaxID=2029103 RepID=A0A917EJT1_9RHOB|nr:N-formylglutamate amidohydrolase [Actibacterium pelagium]GGE52270.1 N-formylglutamate amidohydrolase [Actibacterium pelagium]